jgi:hypothetical protein
MKKIWIIIAVLVFALIGTVSAFASITFPYSGNLQVTYVNNITEAYNNAFGISLPDIHQLGFTIKPAATKGFVYTGVGRCSPDTKVELYITNPSGHTFYSDTIGGDGLPHAIVTGPTGPSGALSYTVAFEDVYGPNPNPGEPDNNDVIMDVACIQDSFPSPEFPTMALPAALIVGFVGAILFIKSTKEN